MVGSSANRGPRSGQGVDFCPGRVITERFVVVRVLIFALGELSLRDLWLSMSHGV